MAIKVKQNENHVTFGSSLTVTLDAEKVAELVYEAVLKSEIKWTNHD